MNQQEIIENLPPLQLQKGDGTSIVIATGMHVLDCYSKDYSNDVDEAMQYAIVSAINNTYGKNINPESVVDMFNALTILEIQLRKLGLNEMAASIQNIIENATLLKTSKNK